MEYKYKVSFYKKDNGVTPVAEFLDKLNKKEREKLLRDLLILQSEGIALREPYCKHIKNGIYELRSKFSSNIQRVFYFQSIGNEFVLLNGFTKKDQNTPVREIEKAEKYRKDHLSRTRQ